MAKNPFTPLQVSSGPASGSDVNRVQDQVRQAFDKVKTGGKLTSKDGSVTLSPKSGIGTVDLAVFDGGTDPGSFGLSLGSTGPSGIQTSTPSRFFKIVKDGITYMIPAWIWQSSTASGLPMAGLVGWWKGDVGVTTTGSAVTAWSDQSGNGYDLAFDSSSPNLGTGTIPPIDFDTVGSSAMLSTTMPWGTAYSVLVVAQVPSGGDGRLIDWRYSTANRYIWAHSANNYFYQDDDHSEGPYNGLNTAALTYVLVTVNSSTASIYQDTGSTPALVTPVSSGASGNPAPTTGIRIGGLPSASQDSKCKVWEVATWDHDLDSTERAQLAAYLAARPY